MKNIDKELVRKFFEGSLSGEEESRVRSWIEDIELKEQLSSSFLQVWESISLQPEMEDPEGSRMLDHIHHLIKREESVFIKKVPARTRVLQYLSRAAAILFIPLLVASFYFYHRSHSVFNEIPVTEIYAPVGTRTSFNLPDGTRGWLNGGSTIQFPAVFQGKTRSVELTGEAYLDVIKDKSSPFVVSTPDLQVKVYGTSFNVMAYQDEDRTEVTLESGMVEVYKKGKAGVVPLVKLQPGQTLIYDLKKESGSLINDHALERTAWIEGKLVFRYEPFSEVIRKINRWYNVDIRIMDRELKDHSYYGTFQNETLEEVLKLLKLTAPIAYTDLGRKKNPDGTYAKRVIEIYANTSNSKK